jgi:hypothetical protein
MNTININHLDTYIKDYSIITIGFNYINEKTLDKILTKIKPINILNIDGGYSYNIKYYMRNKKIECLLKKDYEQFSNILHLSLAEISYPKSSNLSSSQYLKKILTNITEQVKDNNMKLLISAPINRDINDLTDNSYPITKGGLSPIYLSDLYIMINEDDKITIFKDRLNNNI